MHRLLYVVLRLVSRCGFLIQRRFTGSGLLVLAALLATATVGVDTQQTLAYQLFVFLFFLVLCASAQVWFFKAGMELQRSLPPYATVGEAFEYRIELRNRSKRPQIGLRLLENLADPRPDFESFVQALRRPSEAKGIFKRFSVWDRWQRMLAANQPAEIAELALPVLPLDRPVEVRATVTPRRRGVVDLIGFSIARVDCFGLFKALLTTPQRQSLLVLPKRYQVPELLLPGSRVYQHGGVTLASTVGESEEFVGLRDYRAGDPLKQIHWKSFARVGTPVVKEHQDEFFERYALVLDTFTEGLSLRAFEEAVSIAASFAVSIDTQECLLDMLFVGSETYCFTAGRGQLHTGSMLELLAHVMPCEGKTFEVLHQGVMERRSQLSGCILVLLAYDDARRALLNELRATGLSIKALVVGTKPESVDADPDLHFLDLDDVEQGLAAL